jgi:hypothetical protein
MRTNGWPDFSGVIDKPGTEQNRGGHQELVDWTVPSDGWVVGILPGGGGYGIALDGEGFRRADVVFIAEIVLHVGLKRGRAWGRGGASTVACGNQCS